LTIGGDRIAIRVKDGRGESWGTFKLDSTKKPNEIRITWLIAWFGIYKVEDDTLTICMNENTNLPLPNEFRTMADSERMLFVYHREKPTQEKKGQGVDKRPDLSGIQFVPEIKKPGRAQQTTDPSTPDVRALRGHGAAVYFAAFFPQRRDLGDRGQGHHEDSSCRR